MQDRRARYLQKPQRLAAGLVKMIHERDVWNTFECCAPSQCPVKQNTSQRSFQEIERAPKLTTLIMGSIADQPRAAHTLTSAKDLTTALCCSKTSGMQMPENTESDEISEACRARRAEGRTRWRRLTGVGEDTLTDVGHLFHLVARDLGDRMHVAERASWVSVALGADRSHSIH